MSEFFFSFLILCRSKWKRVTWQTKNVGNRQEFRLWEVKMWASRPNKKNWTHVRCHVIASTLGCLFVQRSRCNQWLYTTPRSVIIVADGRPRLYGDPITHYGVHPYIGTEMNSVKCKRHFEILKSFFLLSSSKNKKKGRKRTKESKRKSGETR